MTLENLGNLGDLIGGIGVIATLIYLAVQIRQNTTALRTSFYAQAAAPTWDLGALLIQNKELARIFRVGFQDPSQLDEDEGCNSIFFCTPSSSHTRTSTAWPSKV